MKNVEELLFRVKRGTPGTASVAKQYQATEIVAKMQLGC
jgi:hypothetical protein